MSRDWQKDMLINLMQRTERAKADGTIEYVAIDFNALTALIEEAAAEKERGDKLKQERDDAISGLTESYKELSWNYNRMKLRERELKETMKWAIEQSKWGDPENALVKVIAMLQKTLASLYPKEETK